jgi:serine/threonine-protein kinase
VKFRRFTPEHGPVLGPGAVLGIAIVLGASLLGYLIAALVIFPAPISETTQPVPRVLGQPFTSAEATLQAAGFRVRRDEEVASATALGGIVVWQDPPPETRLPPSAVVHLSVSTGPDAVAVPDVVNLQVELAKSVMLEAGFTIQGIDSIAALSPPGTVLTSRPGFGVVRKPGDSVTLVVSRGPADIPVPALKGLSRDQAADRLTAAGLRVGYVRYAERPGVRDGTVLDQRPGSGVRMPGGGRVDLTLARTP